MQTKIPTGRRGAALLPLLVLCAAATLVACQEDPLAPSAAVQPNVLSLNGSGCQNLQQSGAQHTSMPPMLAGVTVTATFTGLPWNIMQQMRYPLYYGADRAACFNTSEVTYVAETDYAEAFGEIPAPDGVNAEWWASLSPRERKALLKYAEEMMRLYPDRYNKPSSVINQFFEASMLRSKLLAKLRATDFFGAGQETELFAGGVYGCTLYQSFVNQPDWVLSNGVTLELVIELVTAFAEAEFVTRPYRGMAFGRNGTIGAAMAAQDGFGSDCGTMLFNSVPGGRITVTDPYAVPPSTPGDRNPPLPPEGPSDWLDR